MKKKSSKWIRNIIISKIYVLNIEVDKSLFYIIVYSIQYTCMYIALISIRVMVILTEARLSLSSIIKNNFYIFNVTFTISIHNIVLR